MSYKRNNILAYIMSVSTGLSFASALLVPFFMENGLNQTQIMLLQTIFSAAVVLLEVPTGYVADRYGRRASLMAGSLAVAVGFAGYASVDGFWLFAAAELLLALGIALLSGANEALVYDGMLADSRAQNVNGSEVDSPKQTFRTFQANVQSLQFGTVMIAAPIGSLIAASHGIRSVLYIEAVIAVFGFACSFFLREPPIYTDPALEPGRTAWSSMRQVFAYCLKGHEHIPYLILLGSSLSAVTYFGFWLAPAYYESVGIPLAWFGVILAVRSGLKVLLSQSHRLVGKILSDDRQLAIYSTLSVAAYLLLAVTQQPFGILFLGLFDVIQALHGPIISGKLHELTPSHIRAQVMSVASLGRRGMYALLGPLFGLGVDHSVPGGFVLAAVVFLPLCFVPLFKLRQKEVVKM